MTSAADRTPPTVDYTATGWRSLREAMEAYALETYGENGWTDFNANNPGAVLFDAIAMVGEMLMYNLNAFAREQLVTTQLEELSFLRASKSFGYTLNDAGQAVVTCTITSDPGELPYTLLKSFQVSNGDTQDPVVFQPTADTVISAVSQEVEFIEGSLSSNELLGTSDASHFQSFAPAFASVIESTLIVRVGGVVWDRVANYADMQPTTNAYVVERTEGGTISVRFGDGVNGTIPSAGAEVRADYKTGGGSRGIVDANKLTTILTPATGLLSITNNSSSTGGAARQTVAQGQKLLPASIRTMGRAVGPDDYAAEALNVSGISKAIELDGASPKTVLLPIAPTGGGNPSSLLKSQTVAHFRDVKPVTFRVIPMDPRYTDWVFALNLHVNPNYRQAYVKSVVEQYILDLYAFENVDFGTRLPLQDAYESIRSGTTGLEGVSRINITAMTAASVVRAALEKTNTGDGTFDRITTTSPQRATYLIDFDTTSPYTTYQVTRRIRGVSSSVTDLTLAENGAAFADDEHVGKVLNPNVRQATTFTITANTQTTLTVAVGSLQSVGIPEDEYAIDEVEAVTGKLLHTTVDVDSLAGQKRVFVADTSNYQVGDLVLLRDGTTYEVGEIASISAGVYLDLVSNLTATYTVGATVDFYWQSSDGTLGFAVVQGASPFVVGDAFFIDTHPTIDDVVPRREEIPRLLSANLAVRAIGGVI